MSISITSEESVKVINAASDLARCLELYHDWKKLRGVSTAGSGEDDLAAVQVGLLLSGRLTSAAASSVELKSVFDSTSGNLKDNAQSILDANEGLFSEQTASWLQAFAEQDRTSIEDTLAELPSDLATENTIVMGDVFRIQSGVGPAITAAISQTQACRIAAGVTVAGIMSLNPYLVAAGVGFSYGAGC